MPFILGQDIGYSNLKLMFGEADTGSPQIICLPSQAAPMAHFLGSGEYHVLVDGELWGACIEPGRASNSYRALHEDFSRRESYRALFHASLAATGRDTIDILVSGLPVHQFLNRSRRSALRDMLTGTHKITDRRSVEVKEVYIVPQPMGAFWDVHSKLEDPALLDNGFIVVLDVGYFSVGYIIYQRGEIVLESSNASLQSMSVILEDVNVAIANDHGEGPGTDKLEIALQHGWTDVFLHGKRLPLAAYLGRASLKVLNVVLNELKSSIRFYNDCVIDAVILTGGGAQLFEARTREMFPESRIIYPEDPVTSNAEGFWVMGASRFVGE